MMKDGRLVERGSHAELTERRGEYFKLVSYDTTAGQGQQDHPGDDRPAPDTAAQNGNQPMALGVWSTILQWYVKHRVSRRGFVTGNAKSPASPMLCGAFYFQSFGTMPVNSTLRPFGVVYFGTQT